MSAQADAHALKEPVVNGIGVGSCSSAAWRTEGAFEAQIPTEVLRQDQSRGAVYRRAELRTFATRLNVKGIGMRKLMGHQHISTTALYCDVSDEQLRNAVELV
jgi:hypothetical protein